MVRFTMSEMRRRSPCSLGSEPGVLWCLVLAQAVGLHRVALPADARVEGTDDRDCARAYSANPAWAASL